MRKLTFRGWILVSAAFTGLVTVLTALGYAFLSTGWLLTLAICFGTTFYHFAMRLLVGLLVPAHLDHRHSWFQPKAFEAPLYKRLRVKQWKDRMPTYDPRLFSLTENTLEDIIGHTCQAELVHEIIVILSFLPLLFSLIWDSFPVFLITSVLAAAIDCLFVVLQRYNRPRLVKILTKQQSGGIFHEKTHR